MASVKMLHLRLAVHVSLLKHGRTLPRTTSTAQVIPNMEITRQEQQCCNLQLISKLTSFVPKVVTGMYAIPDMMHLIRMPMMIFSRYEILSLKINHDSWLITCLGNVCNKWTISLSKQALLMGGPSPPPLRLDQGWVICKRIIRWAHDDWDMLVISGIDCVTTQIGPTLSQISLKSTISEHISKRRSVIICCPLYSSFEDNIAFISISLACPAPADDDEHTPLSFASFCTFRGFSDKCGGDSAV